MPTVRIDLTDSSVIFCNTDWIPPVGSEIQINGIGQSSAQLAKVTAHEWHLNPKNGDPDDKNDLPEMELRIKVRVTSGDGPRIRSL